MNTEILGYGLYAIAYGTSILAFLMTRINYLRILFVISSASYALYYFIFPAEPLWLDVISEGAFVIVNIFMLGIVFYSSKRAKFTTSEHFLFDSCFSSLNAYEFKKLLAIAEWRIVEADYHLIKEDTAITDIFYLFSGKADVIKKDNLVYTHEAGALLGELSYALDQPTSADVIIRERSVLLVFSQKRLKKLTNSNERIADAIKALIIRELSLKLSTNVVS
ncbi:cyclic nucleotide-binding domain-containing protein [Granulosicoccus sp.]|nr:cyclic nucleotide-binding domain-containing protein [Granulosicoccus sp.]MDB4223870.1 cyclic nucleotide-binding domain-containing protein [Granulosicoccus sp.]